MQHAGLKARMILVGGILFAFYLGAATVLSAMFGVDLIVMFAAGLLLLPPLQYKLGKWMALRGAEEMPETAEFREVHEMNERLAREMGVPEPKLMVQQMGVPNAFAVGRKGAGVVCVSVELLQLLDRDELEGVMAHEMAHIRNRDVITMVLGQSIATLVGYVVYFVVLFAGDDNPAGFVFALLASSLANMLVMVFVAAISRYREYVADDDARDAIGSGEPLARALEKISAGTEGRDSQVADGVNALCIFNADRGLLRRLRATHPPTEKRIQKLRS